MFHLLFYIVRFNKIIDSTKLNLVIRVINITKLFEKMYTSLISIWILKIALDSNHRLKYDKTNKWKIRWNKNMHVMQLTEIKDILKYVNYCWDMIFIIYILEVYVLNINIKLYKSPAWYAMLFGYLEKEIIN